MFVVKVILTVSAKPHAYRKVPSPSNVMRVNIQDAVLPFKRPLRYLQSSTLKSMTIRQLKQRAKDARIPRYSRMQKHQLIAALRAKAA